EKNHTLKLERSFSLAKFIIRDCLFVAHTQANIFGRLYILIFFYKLLNEKFTFQHNISSVSFAVLRH
ncbi:unnamed protein product, partial [Arabidopsis halleri]